MMASKRVSVGGYSIGEELGRGTYSRVFLGTNSAEGQVEDKLAAIKELWKGDTKVEVINSYKNELKILNTCNHPNIVKLLHHEEREHHLYLVLQFCNNGNLKQYMQVKKSVPLERRLLLSHDACQGLIYLHGKQILHRDLKPDNLLVHQDKYGLSLILGDVGIGRIIPDGKTNQQLTLSAGMGTPGWMAPENYSDSERARYNRESDIYSLGLCLAAILIHEDGEPLCPFEGRFTDVRK